MRYGLRYAGSIGLAIIVVLLFLLTSAGTTSGSLERYFGLLLLLNAFVALMLFITVISLISRLRKRLKEKQFGSRMLMKLVTNIAFVTLVPSLLIYAISSHLINQAMDDSAEYRIEAALDSGVALAQSTLDHLQDEQTLLAHSIAKELADINIDNADRELVRLCNHYQLADLKLIDTQGYVIAQATTSQLRLSDILPSLEEITLAEKLGYWSSLEGDPMDWETHENDTLRIRSLVFLTHRFSQQSMVLQVQNPIPEKVAQNINSTIQGLQQYQQSEVSRSGLHMIYKWSLLITITLAVLCAILMAFSIANRMTAPIRQLAAGTRQATGGNLQLIKEFSGADEINELTTAFNAMIRQLNDAWHNLETQKEGLEQHNIFLKRILENLSSGVIVLNKDKCLRIANLGAVKLFGDRVLQEGSPLKTALPELAVVVAPLLHNLNNEVRQEDASVQVDSHTEPLPVMIRTSSVPLKDGPGYLIVIDDMSQAIAAQRVIAWGEVARRLAHEIKNPLTPIQLAAERMEMKLEKHLPENERTLLHRYTHTIVDQVTAMKQMVNDFRDYAKLPKPRTKSLNLNKLLDEISHLYQQNDYEIVLNLDENIPEIMADRAQMLQVIHNVLSNSREARQDNQHCIVTIKTETCFENTEKFVKLTFTDNGGGFPAAILDKAFEPYITTKAMGTGLGLPMVKKIIDEHGGTVKLSNQNNALGQENSHGAVVTITFNVLA